MRKIVLRGLLIVGFFFGTWFALQQINWVRFFDLNYWHTKTNRINELEKKLGELVFENFENQYIEIDNPLVISGIDSLKTRICEANSIDMDSLQIYVFESPEVNAFALPDRQLVLYSGLIEKTETPEALCGVIAHELAHIEKGHVMQSLIRELGLSILFTFASGQVDYNVLSQIGQMLSSSAFSRKMEKEADLAGVDYLFNAKINPQPFADFTKQLDEFDLEVLKWISSHPLSKERNNYISQNIKKRKVDFKEVINTNTWKSIKEQLKDE